MESWFSESIGKQKHFPFEQHSSQLSRGFQEFLKYSQNCQDRQAADTAIQNQVCGYHCHDKSFKTAGDLVCGQEKEVCVQLDKHLQENLPGFQVGTGLNRKRQYILSMPLKSLEPGCGDRKCMEKSRDAHSSHGNIK